MAHRQYSRPYVGVVGVDERRVFRSVARPTATTHPQYLYVVGPFRTMRGARYLSTYGRGTNWTVTRAERLAAMIEARSR